MAVDQSRRQRRALMGGLAMGAGLALVGCATEPTPPLLVNAQLAEADGSSAAGEGGRPAHWRIDGKPTRMTPDRALARAAGTTWRVEFDGAGPYAGIVQALPIEAVRGRRLALAADLARSGADPAVGLWIRAFDADRKSIAYANSYQQPAAAPPAFTRHELQFEVPQEARAVLVGASIYGAAGAMWIGPLQLRAQR